MHTKAVMIKDLPGADPVEQAALRFAASGRGVLAAKERFIEGGSVVGLHSKTHQALIAARADARMAQRTIAVVVRPKQ